MEEEFSFADITDFIIKELTYTEYTIAALEDEAFHAGEPFDSSFIEKAINIRELFENNNYEEGLPRYISFLLEQKKGLEQKYLTLIKEFADSLGFTLAEFDKLRSFEDVTADKSHSKQYLA